MLPVSQLKICFSIPASPTDNFYSQIAIFRLALDALGGVYKNAHIILSLGDRIIEPLSERWLHYFGESVKLHWADPKLYKEIGQRAQGDNRWQYDYDEYDLVVFSDADTIILKPIDEVLIDVRRNQAVAGVIAHYPFPHNEEESVNNFWHTLAKEYVGKPIELNYHYTLIEKNSMPEDEKCPFYLNFGFFVMTPQVQKKIQNTFLDLRSKIIPLLKDPRFSGQIALTLSLLAHDIPDKEIGIGYNFPNDPVADSLYPEELKDVRLIHYLRTDRFDRHSIFVNEEAFNDFLLLKLKGSNKVFQDYIRKLTKGRYPFKYKQSSFPRNNEQHSKAWKIELFFRRIRALFSSSGSFFVSALRGLINSALYSLKKIRKPKNER